MFLPHQAVFPSSDMAAVDAAAGPDFTKQESIKEEKVEQTVEDSIAGQR